MKQRFSFKQKKFPRYIFTILIILCWSAAFFQIINTISTQRKSIPAYQNQTIKSQPEANHTFEFTNTSAKITPVDAKVYAQSMAKKLDSNSRLLSSHESKKYSDYYFYSPAASRFFPNTSTLSSNSYNMQLVFCWDKQENCRHIYLGIPFIDYSF